MTATNDRKNSMPWDDIATTAMNTTLRNAYEEHVKPLGLCTLKTFRNWCAARGVYSKLSAKVNVPVTRKDRTSARYTAHDDETIRRMKAVNATAKEIGAVLGRSAEAVSARAVAIKCKTNQNEVAIGQAKTLDEVNWQHVSEWLRRTKSSKTAARNKFAKGVALTMFIERLKSVTECNTARITLDSFMPACSASGIYRR